MSRDLHEATDTAMPLAMAALDVAGAVRERSPTDMAIFGETAGRLAERFLKPEIGQTLLARAVSDGTAEAVAWLVTQAGQRLFRVSLWRQRGGERIRVLACFAACDAARSGAEDAAPAALRSELMRLATEIQLPLASLTAMADRLRAGQPARDPGSISGASAGAVSDQAADIVAAAWRLRRLTDDLLEASAAPGGAPRLRIGEVDIARLARRILRLAAPAAAAAGVEIAPDSLPAPGQGPLVLGDEGRLWGGIEELASNAIRHAGRGARLSLSLAAEDGGQALSIADTGPGMDPARLADLLSSGGGLGRCRETVRANGAELEITTAPGQGLTARIRFPAARCLTGP